MGSPAIRWVALDAMGVLYRQRRMSRLLSSFCSRFGATVDPKGARELYVRASLGEMTSAALWEALGIPGPGRDREFLEGRGLMPGVHEFLAQMQDWGVSVACITNDLAEWSLCSRRAHGLEDGIGPWVVSGEVGVRKPGPGIYRRFLELAGATSGECLFVDDQVENLDAAEQLGFPTAWFSEDASGGGRGHLRLGSFDEVLDLIEELQTVA